MVGFGRTIIKTKVPVLGPFQLAVGFVTIRPLIDEFTAGEGECYEARYWSLDSQFAMFLLLLALRSRLDSMRCGFPKLVTTAFCRRP